MSNAYQKLKHKIYLLLQIHHAENIQFQIDKISDRKMINLADIKNIDPVKNGIIVIDREYEKLQKLKTLIRKPTWGQKP